MTATTSTGTAAASSRGTTVPRTRATTDRGRVPRLIIFYLVLLLIVAIFIIPYLFALNASFKPLANILAETPWTPAKSLSFTNYIDLFQQYDFGTYLLNTLMVT